MVKRAYRFVRSLLPSDHTSLLLLIGFACLFIAPSLGWWPQEHPTIPGHESEQEVRQVYYAIAKLLLVKSLLSLPIRFAGAAVLFICFWPGRNPERRLLFWVLVPAVAGLLGMVAGLLFFGSGPSSILSTASERIANALKVLKASPGFHYAIAGMAAVALAAFRLRLGKSVLPISLEHSGEANGNDAPEEAVVRQDWRFIWIMIVGSCAALAVGQWLTFITVTSPISGWRKGFSVTYWLWLLAFGFVQAFMLAYAIGRGWRGVLSTSLHLPRLKYVGLAVLFPLAVAGVTPLGRYLLDRVHWAAHDWGHFPPPSLPWGFHAPPLMLIWPFLPALIEEIGWRGYLQPRFIDRYGLFRGIALTSVVWGAVHFGSDFRTGWDDLGVASALVMRLVMTGVLSFALAWVTLHSESVIPAGILHGLYNVLLYSFIPSERGWFYFALWAVLALALFRFWPPRVTPENIETKTPSMPEPAS